MSALYVYFEGTPPTAAIIFGPEAITEGARRRISRTMRIAHDHGAPSKDHLRKSILKILEEEHHGHQ